MSKKHWMFIKDRLHDTLAVDGADGHFLARAITNNTHCRGVQQHLEDQGYDTSGYSWDDNGCIIFDNQQEDQ